MYLGRQEERAGIALTDGPAAEHREADGGLVDVLALKVGRDGVNARGGVGALRDWQTKVRERERDRERDDDQEDIVLIE